MYNHVGLQSLRLSERLVTEFALECTLGTVDELVALQIGFLVERPATHFTRVWPQTGVREHVRPQVVFLSRKEHG